MRLSRPQRQMLAYASQHTIALHLNHEFFHRYPFSKQASFGKVVTLTSLERRGLLRFDRYEKETTWTGPWQDYPGKVHFTLTDAGREALQ